MTRAKIRKLTKGPLIGEWIKKSWDICTMEYYSTIKVASRVLRTIGIISFHGIWLVILLLRKLFK